jgi:hypothetical protein
MVRLIRNRYQRERKHKFMRDWVRPFLSIEEQESVDDDAIYSELAGSFNLNFGRGIFGGEPELMRTSFGFVLAHLPEEVFTKLSEMKNLFLPIPLI